MVDGITPSSDKQSSDSLEMVRTPATILLVDDEPAIVRALASELRMLSHTVHTASSGKEALQVLHAHTIDILVTDLRMPGMDGLELLSQAEAIHGELQTILLTGFGDMQNVIEALNRGAAGYMLKPPDLRELMIHIEGCMRKTALNRALKQKNEELEAEILRRKEAEEALMRAKAYTEGILASMADALIVTSPQGVIQTVNPPGCDMLEFMESELIGRHIDQLFMESEEAACLGASLELLMQQGSVSHTETLLTAKSGRNIPVFVSGAVMYDSDHLKIGIIFVAKDVTDYKQAQQALREKNAQLIHAGRLTAMGEMATGIAHELNQPLTIIRIAAQNLGYKIKGDVDVKAMSLTVSKQIMQQVDRSASIINHMRIFARGEVEEDNVELIDPSIPTLDALTFFQEQFRIREIELSVQIENTLPKICFSPNRFEQVIVNLLSNARYAVDKLKDFNLRSDLSDTKKVALRLFQDVDQGCLILDVEDNGIGMSKEEQERCWEPFFSTKEVGEGTGLGLYIIHGILKERDGTIRVQSLEGEGTLFQVRIPVASEHNGGVS